MSSLNTCIAQQVREFCTHVGADPLLVQGAGGNVSWKDGHVLWVKASGTWLAEAETKEIFVPVNIEHLHQAIAKQDFSVSPEVNGESGLRPSIETILHALMPHKVVVHLHAVEILAHLVKINAVEKIKSAVGDSLQWLYVDYFKPGADLAKAVSHVLIKNPHADVVFMGNHGVVIGGQTVNEVLVILETLITKLKTHCSLSASGFSPTTHQSDFITRGYIPLIDNEVSLLALKKEFINRVRYQWALYPDHVVFLGAEATILEQGFSMHELDDRISSEPPFIIAIGEGVYESFAVTPAQKSQLRCYFDVVSKLDENDKISVLNKQQVYELLDWDAEKYRKNIYNN